jgi:hypothetical protein
LESFLPRTFSSEDFRAKDPIPKANGECFNRWEELGSIDSEEISASETPSWRMAAEAGGGATSCAGTGFTAELFG